MTNISRLKLEPIGRITIKIEEAEKQLERAEADFQEATKNECSVLYSVSISKTIDNIESYIGGLYFVLGKLLEYNNLMVSNGMRETMEIKEKLDEIKLERADLYKNIDRLTKQIGLASKLGEMQGQVETLHRLSSFNNMVRGMEEAIEEMEKTEK